MIPGGEVQHRNKVLRLRLFKGPRADLPLSGIGFKGMSLNFPLSLIK